MGFIPFIYATPPCLTLNLNGSILTHKIFMHMFQKLFQNRFNELFYPSLSYGYGRGESNGRNKENRGRSFGSGLNRSGRRSSLWISGKYQRSQQQRRLQQLWSLRKQCTLQQLWPLQLHW